MLLKIYHQLFLFLQHIYLHQNLPKEQLSSGYFANDTVYGLAGAVFTNDAARAIRVIKEIRAGITWINCDNPAFTEGPWGGRCV